MRCAATFLIALHGGVVLTRTGVQSLLPLSSPWRPDPGQAVRRTSPGNSGTAGGSSAGSSSRGQPPSHSQALISLHSVRKRSKPQPWRKAPQTSPRLTQSVCDSPVQLGSFFHMAATYCLHVTLPVCVLLGPACNFACVCLVGACMELCLYVSCSGLHGTLPVCVLLGACM